MIKGLPEKLQTLRIGFGYSQKQVADILGVSPSIISGYETGERTPSTDVLLSLAHLYKCSTDYLLGRDNQSHIMIDCQNLTDAQIQALRQLIEAFTRTQ
ncbi:MAG: helix-turn-helix transcriptional regulator [Clostridia bacterium]|nr:helix-turn-helix transcriptional regulator [Clostridia bacterium]